MPLPTNKKYRIIYADPPWSYNNGSTTKKTDKDFGKFFGRPESHYDTMSLLDMKALKVQDLADDNCLLFMWATFPKLDQAIELVKAWGFKYVTTGFVWVKTQSDGRVRQNGTGWYTISNAEIVLIGRKGKFKKVDRTVKQIVMEPNTNHSKKPDSVRSDIVRLCGDVPRIELFARERSDGWDSWGNELPP